MHGPEPKTAWQSGGGIKQIAIGYDDHSDFREMAQAPVIYYIN